MFTKSAYLYDAVYTWVDYAGGSEKLHRLLQARNPGASTLLDVACGTGGHLVYLKDHYRTEGVDLDEQMLEIARKKLPGITFHRGNMIDFSLGRKFDAVTCLFSSIGYVGSVEKMERAVAAMAGHLAPGGVLAIEPWFLPDKWEDGRIHANFVDRPELKIARMAMSRRVERRSYVDFQYLVVTPEGFDHFSETHELYLFDDGDYRSAFEKAGLTVELDEEGLMGRGVYLGVASK